MFAPLLATYTLAAYRPRQISLPIMGLIVVGSAIAIWGGDGSDAADVAVGYFAGITAWVVGDSTRTQRERDRVDGGPTRAKKRSRPRRGSGWRSRAICTTSWRTT